MADEGVARTRQQGLQQAASVIFALVAIVPLLIFAWTLHTLGAIGNTQAQLSLGLALAVSLLGFWMFRSMLARMAAMVQALAAAVEQANRAPREPTPTAPAPREGPVPAALTPRGLPGVAPRPAADVARQVSTVAGIGDLRELTEVVRAMDALWHREASVHLGRRVQISVANSRETLVGLLAEASSDGLILEQDEGPIAVAYGRITAIDPSS
jgi:hypothetical protein